MKSAAATLVRREEKGCFQNLEISWCRSLKNGSFLLSGLELGPLRNRSSREKARPVCSLSIASSSTFQTPGRGLTGRPRRPPGCDGEKNGWLLFENLKPRAEGFETEILTKFTFLNPINHLACMRKPQKLNTLTVRVIARDKSSTRRLITAIFHGTSPQGEQSSAECSRRSANGESVSEKLYWGRKIATEGQYGHFVKAEKSEEQMVRSPV